MPQTLLVSVLTLGAIDRLTNLLQTLPAWLAVIAMQHDLEIRIVMRNNDPNVSCTDLLETVTAVGEAHPELNFSLVTGDANTGFGRGHNENFRLFPSDYLLLLNDDLGFPHVNWLPRAVEMFRANPNLALIGDVSNPRYVNPFFGNGVYPSATYGGQLKYAEASVLLANGQIFSDIGMFNEKIEWAMCEDADLSLRAQQLGFDITWIEIPHQHWRGSTFNVLPSSVKFSIQEHNRAVLFCAWRESFSKGVIGNYNILDIWTDGIGDLFCLLPHLSVEFECMTELQRRRTVVNTKWPELLRLVVPREILITSVESRDDLKNSYGLGNIASIASVRDINYSLPFPLQTLLCGALGIPVADRNGRDWFRNRLLEEALGTTERPVELPEGPICVVHIEFLRQGHDGRAPSAVRSRELFSLVAEQFPTIVLVGMEKRLGAEAAHHHDARVIDLRGQLSLPRLMLLMSRADYFVGIDSFPAHVAQAFGVRSAIFFGSIHPLARVWDQQLVWPLVADLPCIGCYHTHLEASVPFCMRRNNECTTALPEDATGALLRDMIAGVPFDWSQQTARFNDLQAKYIRLLRHHPAPPERTIRPFTAGNERVSNMIYEITDMVCGMLAERHYPAVTSDMKDRIAQLEGQLMAKEAELEQGRRRKASGVLPADTRKVPLYDVSMRPVQCTVTINEPWIRIESDDRDPMIELVPLIGVGGEVQIQLSAVSARPDNLQIYWATAVVPKKLGFTEAASLRSGISPIVSTVTKRFKLAVGEMLWLRIDPCDSHGRVELRGWISGAFELGPNLREPAAAPAVAPVAAAETDDLTLPEEMPLVQFAGTQAETVADRAEEAEGPMGAAPEVPAEALANAGFVTMSEGAPPSRTN